MLSGPQSAKTFERLLRDPDSFMVREKNLIIELEGDIMGHQVSDEEWARISGSIRFFIEVARLKASVAKQGKTLGTN